MKKNIRTNKEIGLKEPLFLSEPESGSAEVNDIKLDGITYRVWSVFANEREPSGRLADLMQSSVVLSYFSLQSSLSASGTSAPLWE